MVALIDADSLVYKAAYVVANTEEESVVDVFLTQVEGICSAIEIEGLQISYNNFFFTLCSNNFRHAITKTYKANREFNELAKLVVESKAEIIEYLINSNENVYYSNVYEADDLIAYYSKPMNTICVSGDKDLKQIEGFHFDYNKVKNGDFKVYKGLSYTSKQEGKHLMLKQLLTGDVSDNIKGVKGIGEVKSEKLLKGKSEFQKVLTVARQYNNFSRLRDNIKLINLLYSKQLINYEQLKTQL